MEVGARLVKLFCYPKSVVVLASSYRRGEQKRPRGRVEVIRRAASIGARARGATLLCSQCPPDTGQCRGIEPPPRVVELGHADELLRVRVHYEFAGRTHLIKKGEATERSRVRDCDRAMGRDRAP